MRRKGNNGAFGKENRGSNHGRQDFPRYRVTAYYPECLECIEGLGDMQGVHIGGRTTRFETFFTYNNGRRYVTGARLKAAKEMAEHQPPIELPKTPDYKLEALEQQLADDQAAQVIVSDRGNPIKDFYRYTMDSGHDVYKGMRFMIVVKCHGNDMRFRLWNISLGNSEATETGIDVKFIEMDMPSRLRPRFFNQPGPTDLQEVVDIIRQDLDDAVKAAEMNDGGDVTGAKAKQEKLAPFVAAMATAYLKASGQDIHMKDVNPADYAETKAENQETTEEAEAMQATGTDDAVSTDPNDVAGAEAELHKQPSRKKSGATKKSRKKSNK